MSFVVIQWTYGLAIFVVLCHSGLVTQADHFNLTENDGLVLLLDTGNETLLEGGNNTVNVGLTTGDDNGSYVVAVSVVSRRFHRTEKYEEPTMELEPVKSSWKGRPADLPVFKCTIKVNQFVHHQMCPMWSLSKKNFYISMEIERHSLRKNCTETSTLKISPEGLKKRQLFIGLKCSDRVGGKLNRTIFLTVLPFLRVACNFTYQCRSEFSRFSECSKSNSCVCFDGYYYDGLECKRKSGGRPNTAGVYKATLVAIAAFTITVISLFIVYMCNRKKNLFRRNEGPLDDNEEDEASPQGDDVFSVSDHLARMRLSDKPPTYQDVVKNDRMQRGVPPPAYSPTSDQNQEPCSSNSPEIPCLPDYPSPDNNLPSYSSPDYPAPEYSGPDYEPHEVSPNSSLAGEPQLDSMPILISETNILDQSYRNAGFVSEA